MRERFRVTSLRPLIKAAGLPAFAEVSARSRRSSLAAINPPSERRWTAGKPAPSVGRRQTSSGGLAVDGTDLALAALGFAPPFRRRFICVTSALAVSSLGGLTTYEIKSAGQAKLLLVRAFLARENLTVAPRTVSCHRRLLAANLLWRAAEHTTRPDAGARPWAQPRTSLARPLSGLQ
jgi:hypothetical protein